MVSLEQRVKDRALHAMAVCGVALASATLAVAGSYVGEGAGYLVGHVMDWTPYARDLAPWLAERSGLAMDAAQFNVDFYQTTGALTGFAVGGLIPVGALGTIYLTNLP